LLEDLGLLRTTLEPPAEEFFASLGADSEHLLSLPVVFAQQLPEVDKKRGSGLRTTVEVVDANRALVGSNVIPTLHF
jgi:hypothetical protein